MYEHASYSIQTTKDMATLRLYFMIVCPFSTQRWVLPYKKMLNNISIFLENFVFPFLKMIKKGCLVKQIPTNKMSNGTSEISMQCRPYNGGLLSTYVEIYLFLLYFID